MIIRIAQDAVASTLANCAAFQAMVGAADSVAAALKIYQDVLPKPATESYAKSDLIAMRPYAVVGLETGIEAWSYSRIAAGQMTSGCWEASGVFRIEIMKNANSAIDPALDMRAFIEEAGQIVFEMASQYETGGITAERYGVQGPYRIADEHLEELGDHLWIIISVYVGRSGN